MSTEEEKKNLLEDDDLEDGEIDDDDEDGNVLEVRRPATSEQNLEAKSKLKTTIDLTSNEKIEKKSKTGEGGNGSDDFADNLEKTMAAILKKEGIVPKIPEIVLKKRKKIREDEALAAIESSQSKTSRRRMKRKKAQKEKEREKDLEKVSNLLLEKVSPVF